MSNTSPERFRSLVELIQEAAHHFTAPDKIAKVFPKKALIAATGIGTGLGVGASILKGENSKDKLKKNIKLYQAIESPLSSEEDAIDNAIYKKSSYVDAAAYAASATVPSFMALNIIKDKMQNKKTDAGRQEVGRLRDKVNSSYREDMLKAYGVQDEKQLKEAVTSLRMRADDLDKEAMEKESANIGLSTPAAVALTSSLGLGTFIGAKNWGDSKDPRRRQNKDYLNQLDRLYRERVTSPTIKGLPFSDEELMAMELFKQEGNNKKVPKAAEPNAPIEQAPTSDFEPVPVQSEEVDMDSEDVRSILKEL